MAEIGKNVSNIWDNIKADEDPYLAIASEMFSKPIRDVTTDERLKAKQLLLPIIYGGKAAWQA